MRISEVRELDDSELDKELGEQQRGMMNLRFRKATLQLTNTNELKNARKSSRKTGAVSDCIRAWFPYDARPVWPELCGKYH